MKWIRDRHLGSLLAWVVIVVAAIVLLPNINALTRAHSDITLPSNVQSEVADTMRNHWGKGTKNTYETALVFNNGDSAMTKADTRRVKKTIKELRDHKSKYGIKSMTAAYDNAATRKQLISKDKSTVLVQLNISNDHLTVSKSNKQLSNAIKMKGIRTYVTGAKTLEDDFSGAIQEGIKKTEVISVIFIFIVLVVVFRSPIVPLISLLTVGVSFITSFSLVTNLVEKFNFPFSNFTQVFMVIVLFGIGTDYNILLYDQYKENLGSGMDNIEATLDARRKAGRTILMSGTSLLIGFAALGLARFSIYRSAVGVAVGVAVLLIVLLTLNPFFMIVLGKRMFWPVKKFEGETHSPLWQWLSKHSLLHPFLALGLVAVIMVPLALTFQHPLDYNDASEISDSVPSKKGYLVVQDHFSKGTAEPSTLYIHADHRLDNQKDLMLIDQLTGQIAANKDVKLAASVTRPDGSKIKKLYVNNQVGTLNKQLGTAQKGVGQLTNGSQQMGNGINQLSAGSQQLVNGLTQLSQQLNASMSGSNAAQLAALQRGLPQLNSGIQQLNRALNAQGASINTAGLTNELTNVGTQAQIIGNNLNEAGNTLRSIQGSGSTDTSAIQQQYAAAMDAAHLNDQQKQVMGGALNQILHGVQSSAGSQQAALAGKLQSVAGNLQAAGAADRSLGNSLNNVAGSAQSLGGLMGQLQTLKASVAQLAAASNVALPGAAQAIQQLTGGLSQVQSAVGMGTQGMVQLNTGINRLAAASPAMTNGLQQLGTGLQAGSTYLGGLQNSAAANHFYIPNAVLHSKTFRPAMKTYLSHDKKTARIEIVFKTAPSGYQAAALANSLSNISRKSLKGTSLEDAKVAMGGQSERIYNTRKTVSGDFVRTAVIMIVGISLALMFITRSLLQPLYIMGTLVLAYLASLSINHWMINLVMGRDMLTWNTPFFGFIMLIALGVDYSIFLMRRYLDYQDAEDDPNKNILRACANIGNVVISAAIILSGTFAALIPSGIPTLIEVATTVIVGLILLVIIMPVVMSPAVKFTYGNTHARHEKLRASIAAKKHK